MLARIKEKDTVFILSGKDKGKKGLVLRVMAKSGKVVVKDCGLITKHAKARKQTDSSGIKKIEGSMSLAKVMLVCTSCNMPCRVKTKVLEDGNRVRSCARCEEVI